MPKFVTKFSGLLSASSVPIAIAIVVGILIAIVLIFALVVMLWGQPGLWLRP